MTPDELRALAMVMREVGVFKVTLPEGVTIELSQHAIVAGQAEALTKGAPLETATADPVTASGSIVTTDEDDALTFAATEGLPP